MIRSPALVWILGVSVASAFAAEPPITDIAFAPDARSVATVSQAGVRLFPWPELSEPQVIATTLPNLHCLTFSPNGRRLAIGGGYPSEEGNVKVLSWPDRKLVATLTEHQDSVFAVAWLDPSTLVSAGLDRNIQLCHASDAGGRGTLKGHSRGIRTICVLPDHDRLVSAGGDQSLRVWNLDSGKLVRSLNQHTAPVSALARRPSDEGLPMVASASSDRTVRFWQPTIGRMVRYVRLEAEPLSLAWTSDGSRLAVGCVDGCVRIIDPDRVKVLATHPVIDGWVYAVAISPDDNALIAGGTGGMLRRIELNL